MDRRELPGKGRDEPIDQLERRLAEVQLRLTTELSALCDETRALKNAIGADGELCRIVADHERRIRDLEVKTA